MSLSFLFLSCPVLFVNYTSPCRVTFEEVFMYDGTDPRPAAFDPECNAE